MKKLCVLLMTMAAGIAQADNMLPYLQSPTSDSVWVSWKTAVGKEATVFYGNSPENLNHTISGSTSWLGGFYGYHKVKISGLQAAPPTTDTGISC